MDATYKPRHIRDIAHLYISRGQGGSPPSCATVLMAGEDKRCFSGFHAANLAAALATKSVAVRLIEQSGLLPNAGYFMALPPHLYVCSERNRAAPVTGVGGVVIDFSSRGTPALPNIDDRPRIELFHLPPLTAEQLLIASLREVADLVKPITFFVALRTHPEGSNALSEDVAKELRGASVCVIRLGDEDLTAPGHDPSVCSLGCVANWKGALRDRVPAVIRAPETELAGAYLSIGARILAEIDRIWRKPVAEYGLGSSAATRPR